MLLQPNAVLSVPNPETIDLSSWLPCVSWGSLFPKKPVIHQQMAPWISRQLHPQPRKLTIPVPAAPARIWTPGLAWASAFSETCCLFQAQCLAVWQEGERLVGHAAHHGRNLCCRDTVILQDNIHKALQDGCDYFWDGFSVFPRNTICPTQAAASVLMLLPSNRHSGMQERSFPDLLYFLGQEKWGRSMRLILHPPLNC